MADMGAASKASEQTRIAQINREDARKSGTSSEVKEG